MELVIPKKKIVLISSGQPSLNPRLVKEADALANAGYDVTVLYAFWNHWGTAHDKHLLASKKWKAARIGGDPDEGRITWFLSRLIYKASNYVLQKTGRYKYFAESTISRSSYFLIRETKKYKADLYIGHNLGALPAAVKSARFYKKPCGFDAEDFHRQEVSDDRDSLHFKISKYIEDKYLPHVNYLTASSPLIANQYEALYHKKTIAILNVFPKTSDITIINNANKPVKLFWFSQTIGPNRGLENLIEALTLLKDHSFELHLLGSTDENTTQGYALCFNDKPDILHFYKPIPSANVIEFASQFDIGIASEQGTPLNRDICLTNKIFTYIQSGLAVVASDTSGQTALLKQYPTIGKLYQKNDPQALANVLSYYEQHRKELYETRGAALEIAHRELNWETESRKFLNVVEKTLNKVEL